MGARTEKDSAADIGPTHLTLRFKHGKTTILIYALPTDDFRTIKENLLQSLSSVGLSSLNGQTIPKDPDQIELAVPQDKQDLDKGWVPLALAETNGDGSTNGDAASSRASRMLNENPRAAGLKDGAMLAFRFLPPGETAGDPDQEWEVQVASLDDPEVEEED